MTAAAAAAAANFGFCLTGVLFWSYGQVVRVPEKHHWNCCSGFLQASCAFCHAATSTKTLKEIG